MAGRPAAPGVLVAGTQPPDVLELWDWTLGPADLHASEAARDGHHGGTAGSGGTVEVQVDGERRSPWTPATRSPFAGDVSHSYAHPGGAGAGSRLAVFEPGVGSQKTESEHYGRS